MKPDTILSLSLMIGIVVVSQHACNNNSPSVFLNANIIRSQSPFTAAYFCFTFFSSFCCFRTRVFFKRFLRFMLVFCLVCMSFVCWVYFPMLSSSLQYFANFFFLIPLAVLFVLICVCVFFFFNLSCVDHRREQLNKSMFGEWHLEWHLISTSQLCIYFYIGYVSDCGATFLSSNCALFSSGYFGFVWKSTTTTTAAIITRRKEKKSHFQFCTISSMTDGEQQRRKRQPEKKTAYTSNRMKKIRRSWIWHDNTCIACRWYHHFVRLKITFPTESKSPRPDREIERQGAIVDIDRQQKTEKKCFWWELSWMEFTWQYEHKNWSGTWI